MGQYHILANWDKKEWVDPHKIGLGLKQGEQIGNFHASMGDILYLLVAISNGRGGGDVPTEGLEETLGRWAGDRVLVVGDYSEPSDITTIEGLTNPAEQIYRACQEEDPDSEWTDISVMIDHMIVRLWGYEMTGNGWRHRELVDTNTYLGPWESQDKDGTIKTRPDMIIGG